MSDTLIVNQDGLPLSMLPLSVVTWQVAIRLLTLGKVAVIKEHENWVVRSPSVTMNVPSVVVTTDYVKWNRQVKYNRSNILLRDDYKCQYCNDTPPHSHLTMDHVVPRSHGGETSWYNIVAACQPCNSKKGNDIHIVPNRMPTKPSYYELVAKRRNHMVRIRDEFWQIYLNWPNELVQLIPVRTNT